MSCSALPNSVVSDLVVPLNVKTFSPDEAPAESSQEPLQGAGRASNSSDDDAICSLNESASSSSSSPKNHGKTRDHDDHHHYTTATAAELAARNDQQITLYWTSGFGSPPCMRLMISMAEKGLLERAVKIHVNLLAAENRTPDIEKLNQRMQVPILKVGHNVVINESLASCLFLEDEFKDCGTMLIPHNALLKAKVLQRCFEALNLETKTRDIVLPLQNWLPPDLRQPVEPQRIKTAKETLANELNFWERNLAENVTNDFLVGSNFSLADAVFFPSLAWLVKYGLDLSHRGWENLKRYYEGIKDRPSVQASWPPTWTMPSPFGELRMFDDIMPANLA